DEANMAGRLWSKDIFAGYNEVSGTGGRAQLFLKLKVFMPEMKLNSTWVRDALKKTKNKKPVTPVDKLNKTRVIWGKVSGDHRNRRRVHAKFQSNHPAKATGQRIRMMLYPFRISTNENLSPLNRTYENLTSAETSPDFPRSLHINMYQASPKMTKNTMNLPSTDQKRGSVNMASTYFRNKAIINDHILHDYKKKMPPLAVKPLSSKVLGCLLVNTLANPGAEENR
ncbi:hypothetical protein U0070_024824, partial [Myodes glareolus]